MKKVKDKKGFIMNVDKKYLEGRDKALKEKIQRQQFLLDKLKETKAENDDMIKQYGNS